MVFPTQERYHSRSYTYRQVRNVLKEIGIPIEGETHNDFTCLCPYHSNRDTPAMTVSTTKGTFHCFSPQCGESGSLIKLIMDMQKSTEFVARRLIAKHAAMTDEEFESDLMSAVEDAPTFTEFSPQLISDLRDNLWTTPGAREYMNGRGFEDRTLAHFDIGYSFKNSYRMRIVTVPVDIPDGRRIGFIGRNIDGKDFKNSPGLLKSKTLFNIHNARENSTAYVTEASFDSMKLWQAGFPGAVAIAGGNISSRQLHLLDMYFSRIVICTDFDDKEKHRKRDCPKCPPFQCKGHNPGRDLGNTIANKLSHKDILWATYEPGMVYPDGAKDMTDLTDDKIRQCVSNATPNFLYQQWELY